MPEKAQQKLMERLYARQQLHRQKLAHAEDVFAADQRRKEESARTSAEEKRRTDEARTRERERKDAAREAEKLRLSRQNGHAGRPKQNSAKRNRRQENRNSVTRCSLYG